MDDIYLEKIAKLEAEQSKIKDTLKDLGINYKEQEVRITNLEKKDISTNGKLDLIIQKFEMQEAYRREREEREQKAREDKEKAINDISEGSSTEKWNWRNFIIILLTLVVMVIGLYPVFKPDTGTALTKQDLIEVIRGMQTNGMP